MKICLIADPHLFSSEIGGNWSQDSFSIFKDEVLPKVKSERPDVTVLLGDILDPHSGRTDPRWPRGDEVSYRFVETFKGSGIKNVYVLRGNHDYKEALRNISEMGGPNFIEDSWLYVEDTGLYFFSSRYPNLQKAIEDIEKIPEPQVKVKCKILLMHENLSIKGAENIPEEVMRKISQKFEVVFNGHEHIYHRPYSNVWCLPSILPWRVGAENSDVEIIWYDHSEEPQVKENEGKFSFFIFDTDKGELKSVAVDIGVKIIVARLYFLDAPAIRVRERLTKLSELLHGMGDPKRTIVRVYPEGTLKEGDERIDVGFLDIERRYYSDFYEGTSKNILRLEGIRGGGAYLSKQDLRYLSVEDALKRLRAELPKIKLFYDEVHDLIERKSFDGDALIDRIKNSKALEEKDEA